MIKSVITQIIPPAAREAASFAGSLASVSSYITAYAAQASLAKLKIRDRDERMEYFTHNVGKWSRRALSKMNFEVVPVGYNPERMRERNFLMIGNHLSYLDILVLSAVHPSIFVTSIDMGEQAFLGPMAEMGGSLFIERRHRGQIGRDVGIVADTLRAGHDVMLYPEGTSTNGEDVLPFKKSLFMAAVDAKVDILPVVTKYVEIDGEPFGPANRDRVCWYGDMDFTPHFMGLMKLKHAKVELHFLEPIAVTPESDRQVLVQKAYDAIREVYLGAGVAQTAQSGSH